VGKLAGAVDFHPSQTGKIWQTGQLNKKSEGVLWHCLSQDTLTH
jgi:hypothetical protein